MVHSPTNIIMEVSTAQRGVQILIYWELYLYHQRKSRGRDNLWKYHKIHKCSGVVTTLDIYLNKAHLHVQSPSPCSSALILESDKIEAKLKNKARESVQPLLILNILKRFQIHVVADLDVDEVAAALPTFQSVEASFYKCIRKRLPPLPREPHSKILSMFSIVDELTQSILVGEMTQFVFSTCRWNEHTLYCLACYTNTNYVQAVHWDTCRRIQTLTVLLTKWHKWVFSTWNDTDHNLILKYKNECLISPYHYAIMMFLFYIVNRC